MARHLAILSVAFGLLFFGRLGAVGVIDYDEAVYAEVSAAMDDSGDLLVPLVNGERFFEKPPLAYWTQVAGLRLFGRTSFGVRVFNAACALAILLLVYGFARRALGEDGAFWSAVVLGTSLEFAAYARMALTDMWLTFWFVLFLGSFWNAVERDLSGRRGTGWFLLASLACGFAMLTKGVVGILLPFATAIVYLAMVRRMRLLLRPSWVLPGALITGGIGLSWYVLLGLTQPDGFAFLKELFWEHHVDRFLNPMQGHRGPAYYYLLVLLPGLLPWSAILPLAAWRVPLRGLEGDGAAPRRLLRLFLVFAVVTLVFFSVAATKLPSYALPVFPAFALLVGTFVERQWKTSTDVGSKAWRWSIGTTAALLSVLGVAFAALPFVLPRIPEWVGERIHRMPSLATPPDFGPWLYIAACVAFVGVTVVVLGLRHRSVRVVLTALISAFGTLYLLIVLVVAPRVDEHFLAPLRTAAGIAAAAAQPDERVALVGIKRAPSVVFYGGRHTRYVSVSYKESIATLFASDVAVVGIAPEGYLERIEAVGPVEVLGREIGYIVFRSAAKPGLAE